LSTMSIALSSSITPATNDLVYAYTGYSNCGSTSTPSTSSPYSAGQAPISSGSPKPGAIQCISGGGSNEYRLNEGDQYDTSWPSGSTIGSFSVSQTSPTIGLSGWVEIVVEFDPPGQNNPAAAAVRPLSNEVNLGSLFGIIAVTLPVASLRCTSLARNTRQRAKQRLVDYLHYRSSHQLYHALEGNSVSSYDQLQAFPKRSKYQRVSSKIEGTGTRESRPICSRPLTDTKLDGRAFR
jgi:hypothetical protein